MKRVCTLPLDRDEWLSLRSKDVTSTEVSALYNASPYSSYFELWHRKNSGDVVVLEETERMSIGSEIEEFIATRAARLQNWNIVMMKEYMSLPDYRLGASFDYRIIEGDTEGPDDAILECKNVDRLIFRDHWIDNLDGTFEAPPHIEAQVQTQMLVSGLKKAYLAVLVGGNELKIIPCEPIEEVQKNILQKVKEFWRSIDNIEAPSPDFPQDAEFVKSLYQNSSAGLSMIATNEIRDLAEKSTALAEIIKEKTAERDSITAQLFQLIGESEKVVGEDFSVTAKTIQGNTVESYFRKTYRPLRVNWKK